MRTRKINDAMCGHPNIECEIKSLKHCTHCGWNTAEEETRKKNLNDPKHWAEIRGLKTFVVSLIPKDREAEAVNDEP